MHVRAILSEATQRNNYVFNFKELFIDRSIDGLIWINHWDSVDFEKSRIIHV